MRILAIGDIIGKPGRKAVEQILPGLVSEHRIDLVVGNGENAAGGIGLTFSTARELFDAGVDVITTGNHVWAHKEIVPYLDSELALLRPLNYPPANPGRGYLFKNNVLIVNLVGRVFIGHFDCPFRTMDQLLADFEPRSVPIIVDFHAEATSEKVAMGRYLDGRVSAVVGTHTHVGTVDAHILPGGTAYVTDIGMVGPTNSVIGDDSDTVIDRFLTQRPGRLSVGRGKVSFDAMLVDVDENTGKALEIKRIRKTVD
ncbi:MAG: TIGR00282 family metallophosphoesterase [Dehalococcoidia bacterium]|nr:MAG: TIGR00282 family metallophosphoesterase [Dehalococcoidia bacterium]